MAFFGVTAAPAAAERIAAGAPDAPLAALGGAPGIEPGRPVRLIDSHGAVLASGVADPENEVVRVWERGPLRALDGRFFRERIENALALRRWLGLVDGRSAYRLCHGEGEGLAGLSVDVYGAFAVVSAASRGLLPFARLLAEAVLAIEGTPPLGVVGAVIKVRAKDSQDRADKSETIGERPPDELVVLELGVPFEVHLLGALNVGLFSDMREHRRTLGRFVEGRRVLNAFAYTGALSVTAARAGAASVTSVDLSSGVLAWARENFWLSGFREDDSRFAFVAADVRRFLERERERGASYDTILIDPPTVSAARASQWSMRKDYPDLIALAASVLPPRGGILWLAGNSRRGPALLSHVVEGLRRAGRAGAVIGAGGLPPDYPTPPSWPESRYLEVCQVFVPPRD